MEKRGFRNVLGPTHREGSPLVDGRTRKTKNKEAERAGTFTWEPSQLPRTQYIT